jgi:hypothetical protein
MGCVSRASAKHGEFEEFGVAGCLSGMKFSLFLLVGAVLTAGACANGPDSNTTSMPRPDDGTETTEPTEPPPDSVTVPPSNPNDASTGDDDDAGSETDAGSCATTAPSRACGLAPQCGCAANETCDVIDKSTGAVSCVAAGDGVLGSACTETSQCGLGLTCALGACRPYCSTVKSACSGAGVGTCLQATNSSGSGIRNLKVCTIPCDVLSPAAACASNTCTWDSTAKLANCEGAGTRSVRQACARSSDCMPGLACARHPVVGMECERWCRVGHDDECGILQKCNDVYGADGPTQGTDKLGLCQ